jgi:16S rRNA U516 pseudouridylate synthase RsuA-like enzyme
LTKEILYKSKASHLVIYSTGINIVKFCFWQVHEGRNHEVRELVQNAGLKVVLCDQYILVNFSLYFILSIS